MEAGGGEGLKEELTRDVMVDGGVLIDFLKGKSGARDALERAAEEGLIRVSAVTAAQVLSKAGPDRREGTSEMLESFGVVPVDMEVAQLAGSLLSVNARDRLELCDCLVAGSCRQLGAVLITKDTSRYPAGACEMELADY